MKILILTKYFPPEIGAASHLFYELAESLVGRGHSVTVVTGFPTYNVDQEELDRKYSGSLTLTEEMGGITVKRLKEPPVSTDIPLLRGLDHFFIAATTFLRGMFTGNQDVIFLYSPPLTIGLSAFLLGKLKKAPFVVNVQDLFPQNAIDLGILNNELLISFFEWMERFVYKKSSAITVHSAGNKEHVVKEIKDSEKVRVIPNWVDTEFIRPGSKQNSFRKEHDLGDKFVVSFAGTMGYSQDIDIILEAATEFEDFEDILFLLVGEGVEKDRLLKKRDNMRLQNVKFLPMQPKEKYPSVLVASDISLVTLKQSVETPVVPSKLLSIMASGRPVLASMNKTGDAPRLIEESDCGVCVPAEDTKAFVKALQKLYNDEKQREEYAENGREYAVNNLSRKACVEEYEGLFQEVSA